ncbi:MAG: B12-binding domain-containing radical SAM protein, partial [Firmicutes bacterium]|nr:B12-binding domain-containing radical SAM protein [Bacillota bacterium]
MKILLVLPANAPYRVLPGQSVPRRAMLRFSVLPLTTVAALTPPQHQVELVDENVRPLDVEAQADLVALSFMTACAPRAYEIAAAFRKRGIPVVGGGYHPTFCTEEALGHLDAVVKGDAEEAWPRLLSDLESGKLQRIYAHEAPPSLETTPAPRRELLGAWGRYYATQHAVQTSRGCRHGCRFCSITAFHGATLRHRPVDRVLREIGEAPKAFIFVDDNLVADVPYARTLLEGLRPLRKRWASQCTLRIADDPNLLKLAKGAGCVGLFVGLESLDPRNLEAVDKGVNVERDSLARIRKIRQAGIAVQAAVIVGLDHDDPGVFRRTLTFLQNARVDALQLSILTPLPGTPLFADFEAQGRLLDRNWNHYDFRHVVIQPALM